MAAPAFTGAAAPRPREVADEFVEDGARTALVAKLVSAFGAALQE